MSKKLYFTVFSNVLLIICVLHVSFVWVFCSMYVHCNTLDEQS